jgi:diacylglycerol O-acyltransferase / wax synthase
MQEDRRSSMSAIRLSPLDASFLAVESPTAHMHVGWASTFKPPPDRPRPSFEELREHIEGRLWLDPRFRQRLARVPLGLNAPVWIDDDLFEAGRHVVKAGSSTMTEIIDDCMSRPLERGQPLWQLCIADCLDDGRIGVVGKAHHCMVDGIAAVQLAALLLDPTPVPERFEPDDWRPEPTPGAFRRLARGVLDQARGDAGLIRLPLRAATSPMKALRVANQGLRMARATADLLRPAHPVGLLNAPISPLRHLARAQRPLGDLRQIKASFGTTVNDVVLAVSASAMRRHFQAQGERPLPLKTMVPVNLRKPEQDGQDGNRISFMFVDLPCDEPDPVRRLRLINAQTSERKGHGEPQGMEGALNAVGYLPQPIRDAVSQVFASPLVFNLTVSNIPGPAEPMYMLGCELEEAYPVVPIPDGHALSIGVTTIRDRACFGLYADRELLDADFLAGAIDESVDELVDLSSTPR